jgi:hypothetical protein
MGKVAAFSSKIGKPPVIAGFVGGTSFYFAMYPAQLVAELSSCSS